MGVGAGAGAACACSAFGRPVLMDGTACTALRKAASDMPVSTLSPARSSSLFFTGWASAAQRCFKVSMAAYSSLGMVKLSRTSLGFLALPSLFPVGVEEELAAREAGAVAPDGDFFEEVTDFTASFFAGLVADLRAALVVGEAGLAATAVAAVGEDAGAEVVETVMADDEKRYKQFIPFIRAHQGSSTASSQGVFCQA